MTNNLQFLWDRQKDKEKFIFEYTNAKGESKTHSPNGIKFIDSKTGKVELLFPNGIYIYNSRKMKNLRLENSIASYFNNPEIKIEFLAVEEYFCEIISLLKDKNSDGKENVDALNYSLNKVNEMLSDFNQRKMNKKLFKKYLNKEKAKIINDKDQLILLPFSSNDSQKDAIKNAMKYDFSVIQGPPGTGKTQTILNIVSNYIFQGKRVCVVSKNNSAIDNVFEKFETCESLYNFSIRMGNSTEYIPKLMESLKQKIGDDINQTKLTSVSNVQDLERLFKEIDQLEIQYKELIYKRNMLYELRAQKRHIDRKIEIYQKGLDDIEVNPFFLSPRLLCSEVEYLKYRKDRNGEVKINNLFKFYTKFRFSDFHIDTSIYTIYQWQLEKLYAEKMIIKLEKEINNIEYLENQINEKYQNYSQLSINLINQKIATNFIDKKSIATQLLNLNDDIEFYKIKKYLFQIYPVVLTTLDSICSNIGYNKFDLVIIDESSQADIITCLPALNISNQIVIVGDTKQLSHIVDSDLRKKDEELIKKYNINKSYSYSNMNALESIIKICEPPFKLLEEHYRCDYNIINYCNRMYYNDELTIYSKRSNPSSMKIMALKNEKNSDYETRKNGRKSYFNKIEEKAILKYIESDFEDISIITPYGKQEENLQDSLEEMKDEIGTIYKFQGRQNKRILLSTVLTKEKRHCKEKNLINEEMINVAVSRAEEEFVLFTHKKFFLEINHNLKHLITYIETYGNKLESNINSIFAHLYKQIPYAKIEKCYDSLWEREVHKVILELLNRYDGFFVMMKTSLADVIVDKNYLIENPEFKKFALNRNTHIDFLIVSDLYLQPVFAIEVDGKYHKEIIQKERDEKKDKILEDHGIEVYRIKSTDAVEKADIEILINNELIKFKKKLSEFLFNNQWKQKQE